MTIEFRVRPVNNPILSERETKTIVHHLNKAVAWGDFRAVSLDYFGHRDAANIYVTIVYHKAVRHRLEVLEIGNPRVRLTGSQLEDVKNALAELWRASSLA